MISTVILALCLIGDDGRRLTTSGSALGDPSSDTTYTMTNSHSGGDAYQPQIDDPYAPTPGYLDRTPSLLSSPSPTRDCATDRLQSSQLNFLPFAEWGKGDEYDEYPPHYVCYTIAWKLVLNRKTVGKVTEDDLIVAPSEYWDGTLKANVEDMLQMKKKRSQRVRSEGTAVTVSVNDKSLKDFEKFYSSTNIDWKPVEKQLRKWSNLLRMGKKIRVLIAFNYDSRSALTSHGVL